MIIEKLIRWKSSIVKWSTDGNIYIRTHLPEPSIQAHTMKSQHTRSLRERDEEMHGFIIYENSSISSIHIPLLWAHIWLVFALVVIVFVFFRRRLYHHPLSDSFFFPFIFSVSPFAFESCFISPDGKWCEGCTKLQQKTINQSNSNSNKPHKM